MITVKKSHAAAEGMPQQDSSLTRPPLSLSNIKPLPRMTFGEMAYLQLREAILTTQLLPGTPISENDLSSATGVSRTPVREAIRRLVEERLVEVMAPQGTIVSRIDASRAEQAVFVRRLIECEVVRRKRRLSIEALDQLEQQATSHLEAINVGDTLGSAMLDDAFHALLMTLCDFPEAAVATAAVSGDITRILFLSGADKNYFASVAGDHLALVRMMRENDYPAALDFLGCHLGGFVVDQAKLKQQSSDYFVG